MSTYSPRGKLGGYMGENPSTARGRAVVPVLGPVVPVLAVLRKFRPCTGLAPVDHRRFSGSWPVVGPVVPVDR